MTTKKKPTTKTKPRSWFVEKLSMMHACPCAVRYAQKHRTFPAAWNACYDVHWLAWLVRKLALIRDHGSYRECAYRECAACKWNEQHRTPGSVRRQFSADRVSKALRAWGAK